MNILIYNWADIHTQTGGGVGIYVKNIIKFLCKKNNVIFLSSGVKYTSDGHLRIQKDKNFYSCKCYSIINSPVLAPAHSMFNNLDKVIENKKLKDLIAGFLINKNIDIFHINNIEGISLDVLDLKNKFSNIKFIYTFHNYNAVCPQVNLWHSEYENCLCNDDCKKCVNCVIPNDIKKEINQRIFMHQHTLIRIIKSLFTKLYYHKLKNRQDVTEKNIQFHSRCLSYKEYIKKSIEKINKNIDTLISVSQATKSVLCSRGIRTSNHHVMYIGTAFASKQKNNKAIYDTGEITIGYLGYMRHDKGYWHLLWLLKNIDANIAKKIRFVVAARANRATQQHEMDNLQEVADHIAEVVYYNGYNHKNLPEILKQIDLGVIPVLWEDCLPQVAYEFVCNGIPILTSNLGGAKEIGNNQMFIYESKSLESFETKISIFINDRKNLLKFWDTFKKPITVEQHIDALLSVYRLK